MSSLIQNPYLTLFQQQPAIEPVTKAIIYARVSESGRDDTVTSLNKQCDDCYQVASLKRLQVCAPPFTDDRLTGGNTNRPGLRRAIEAARKERAAIVVYDLERLSRSLKDSIEILEKLADEGIPVIVSTGLPIDMSTPHGRLIVQLLAMVNEYYRANQAKQTKEALDYRRKAGKAIGRAPYGWRKEKDGRLEPVRRQQRMIRWIIWRTAQGFGAGHLAKELLIRGYQKHAGVDWGKPGIAKMAAKWSPHIQPEPVELDFWDCYVNYKLSTGTCWRRDTSATMPNLILHRNQVPSADGTWPHYYSRGAAPAIDSQGKLMMPLEQIRSEQLDRVNWRKLSPGKKKYLRGAIRVPKKIEDVDPVLLEGFVWKPSEEAKLLSLKEARAEAEDEFGAKGVADWLNPDSNGPSDSGSV